MLRTYFSALLTLFKYKFAFFILEKPFQASLVLESQTRRISISTQHCKSLDLGRLWLCQQIRLARNKYVRHKHSQLNLPGSDAEKQFHPIDRSPETRRDVNENSRPLPPTAGISAGANSAVERSSYNGVHRVCPGKNRGPITAVRFAHNR